MIATAVCFSVSLPALAVTAGPPTWIFVVFDWVVLLLLGVASIAGIAIAIDVILQIREEKISPASSTNRLKALIHVQDYETLMDFAATDMTFISQSLYAALRRAPLKYGAMQEALENEISEQTSKLFRRIEPLNVIGNIGPLLGLLGTVLGMIMAFYAMVDKGGNPKPTDLAAGIGTALWHTFFGLFVAIPCLVVYGFYRTKADRIANKAAATAEELLESLQMAGEHPNDAALSVSQFVSNPSHPPAAITPAAFAAEKAAEAAHPLERGPASAETGGTATPLSTGELH